MELHFLLKETYKNALQKKFSDTDSIFYSETDAKMEWSPLNNNESVIPMHI